MSSEEDDWMDDCPGDLDPRIFRLIFNMSFYDSDGDIPYQEYIREHKKRPKMTAREKKTANSIKEKSEAEDANQIMKFIKKKGGDTYEYNGTKYSDQINETVELLRNWSETTGMDRDDEHKAVGHLLEEMNRLEKLKKAEQRLAYSKSTHERLGADATLDPDRMRKITKRRRRQTKRNDNHKKNKKPKKTKKTKKPKKKKKN
jgi:hypothetical protein